MLTGVVGPCCHLRPRCRHGAYVILGNAHKLRLLNWPKGGLLDVVFVAQFQKFRSCCLWCFSSNNLGLASGRLGSTWSSTSQFDKDQSDDPDNWMICWMTWMATVYVFNLFLLASASKFWHSLTLVREPEPCRWLTWSRSSLYLSFLADCLGINLITVRRIHRSAGVMSFALVVFHIVVALAARSSFALSLL